ncbi:MULTISPECIES: zinc ribbon domain-containing protein [Haloferax]|uniref:Zinc ribbon domain-containing protein n=1 Tax=Haloferax marinum TaxID=2666143 RepID=A0A6A8G6C8_9EURY|nr:zinc ribbon domain-containing protein [Haloferax sp. CBA1150]KAB1197155.1 zinc ribbon domain-containing protein [Haloferax sp. CBA1150]MRW96188.1 zinc ribbon domain-containing protein [Haloferax marinum]
MSSDSDTAGRDRGPHELFCRNCGAIIDREAEICPACGVRQRAPPKSSVDSALGDLLEGGNPFVAALLSAVFPGLGQIYNRELERGLVFIVATVFAAFSTLVFVGFLLFPAVWLFAIYDAYTRAELRAAELREQELLTHETPTDDPVSLDVRGDETTGETTGEPTDDSESDDDADETDGEGETDDEDEATEQAS